ncbi:hypothetical protein BWQ96_05758 [Gracilariopsis chorda]|uniref:Uncharacterized protein n=1 Tax=Gracilariopsis chorda TaxID=448386 RepID=A0A2V3IQV1_9FLOR|nr:hypothetical protein BWQ96_05758 [Gracilariopsis chorda]|eukprot:PXF44486.1 hypothetical protein BWQ96_05758 [Gracilariopsis chorda]
MRYRGLAGQMLSRWFWIFFLTVESAAVVTSIFLGKQLAKARLEVQDEMDCIVSHYAMTATVFLVPVIVNVMFFAFSLAETTQAIMPATESSLVDGPQAHDPSWSFFFGFANIFRFLSVNRRDYFIHVFQMGEMRRKEKIWAGLQTNILDKTHIEEVIRKVDILLSFLRYDGTSILMLETTRARLFAEVNVMGSVLSATLALSTLGKCSGIQLVGQYLQFISVTSLLFVAMASFAGYGTYKSLLFYELTQADLKKMSEVISLYVANTGKRIQGIRSNACSCYAETDEEGKYDVYVPVISEHVIMRKLKVTGDGILRHADRSGKVMEGLYLIGGGADLSTPRRTLEI